ncbi:hypothetical protein RB595_001795 [Gaeumannomyces hyphopodioides]
MPFPSALLLLGAVCVSGYAFVEHTQATLRLKMKYEEKGRRAARWSSSVERLMWDTRTTIAFGLVASAISFLSALNLVFFKILIPPSDGWVPYRAIWAALVAAAQHYASDHMRAFWRGKPKVPMMGEWNAAIDECKDVTELLGVLRLIWVLVALLKLAGL